MPQKRRRSPAEKKALSYAKDRRNCYGQNDKAARKAIPLNKAKGHRSGRRRAAASLSRYECMDEDAAALVENALSTDIDRLGRWQKCPDQPLDDHIADRAKRRVFRDGRKVWSKKCAKQAAEQGLAGYGRSWAGSEESSSLYRFEDGKLVKVQRF